MNTRSTIKALIPPLIAEMIKDKRGMWKKSYKSWEEAAAKCSGYDKQVIVRKVKEATLKVMRGEAEYERDSVLFDHIQYSWPLLSALLWVAAQNNGELRVTDFGGSLGSSYFQNRKFLKDLKKVEWHIVEQKSYVDIGKQHINHPNLFFHDRMEECLPKSDVLVFSNVLQYLEDPKTIIEQAISFRPKHIVLDHTSFISGSKDLITIQEVPEQIYKASYPCRFFNEEQFLSRFRSAYECVESFESAHMPIRKLKGKSLYWKGFILKHKSK